MRIGIEHSTVYHFDKPVPYALQRARLMPKTTHGQKVLSWRMEIDNGRCESEYDDQHFNHVSLLSVTPGSTEVHIRCIGEVETVDNAGILGNHSGYVPLWLFRRETALTHPSPAIVRLCGTVSKQMPKDAADIARLHALSAAIADEVAYETGRTDAATTADEALSTGFGVCQDHAHIFIACARHMGYPARYVSGYLVMDGHIRQDAGHAWAEAHIDGLGWVGFDISNRICPDERYVRVASGLDYRDAAPVTGMLFGAGDKSMVVSLQVEQ